MLPLGHPRSVFQPLQKSLVQPGCLGGWGPQLQEDRSQCPYYDWSVSEVEGEAGRSRQPPETQSAGCVWVALSPPLSQCHGCLLRLPLTFPTLSCSCLPHGLTERAACVVSMVRGFVTQTQSSSSLPPSPPLLGQEFQVGDSGCDSTSQQAGVILLPPLHPLPHLPPPHPTLA